MGWAFVVKKGATTLTGATVDGFAITHGRRTTKERCPANTCTLTLVRSSMAVNPGSWLVGDSLTVDMTNTGQPTTTMFTGAITDVTVNRDLITVTAVSNTLAAIGRTTVTLPAQTYVTMSSAYNTLITAVQAKGGAPGLSAGSYSLQSAVTYPLQTDVNALQHLQALEDTEPNGVIAQETNGSITFYGYGYRNMASTPTGVPTNRQFDWSGEGAKIGKDWSFKRTVSDKLNDVNVKWASGTESYANSADVTANGLYEKTVTTYLGDQDSALFYGRNIVQHYATPSYVASSFFIDIGRFGDADRQRIAQYMRLGSWVKLPTLDATWSPGFSGEYYCEGWRLTASRTSVMMELFLSDAALTRAGQRWQDVTSGVTWATVNATYDWNDLLNTLV